MATSVQKWQRWALLGFEFGHVGPGRTATLRAQARPDFAGGKLQRLMMPATPGAVPTAVRYNGARITLGLDERRDLWRVNLAKPFQFDRVDIAAGDVLELDVWNYSSTELLAVRAAAMILVPYER